MFSRPGALYVGHTAIPGEVRLRRDRLSVVSHERERTIGAIEQDYYVDDVATVSLTTPSLTRPRRSLRLDLLDGSVEHVWVQEWADSFAQLDAAFRAHREAHPAPGGEPAPSRSTNDWAGRVGPGVPPLVALATLLMSLAGVVLFVVADAFALRLLGLLLVTIPSAAVLWRARHS